MANNLIIPFATGLASNVFTDADWQAYAAIAQGFQAGVAPSKAVNKALRQSTAVASGFGQFTADFSGIDFSDSLTPAQMRDNFRIGLAMALDGARMGVDTNSAANVIQIPLAPTPTTLNGNRVIWIKPAVTNTGATTVQVTGGTFAGLPLKRGDGADPQAGDLAAGRWYATTCDGTTFKLLALTKSEVNALIAGAGAGAVSGIVLGSIGGLVPTPPTGTASSAALTLSAGTCADSTGASFRQTGAINWSVTNGNAANGFQGGTTLPASSTIHLFLIWGTAGTATFASTSLTPTLPTGYTSYRRVWSFLTDGSGAPRPLQFVALAAGGGLRARYTTGRQDASGLTISTARAVFGVSVPSGLPMQWVGAALGNNASNNFSNELNIRVYSPDEPDEALPSPTAQPTYPVPDQWGNPSGLPAGPIRNRPLYTNASGQLAALCNQTVPNLYVVTDGWIDDRTA